MILLHVCANDYFAGADGRKARQSAAGDLAGVVSGRRLLFPGTPSSRQLNGTGVRRPMRILRHKALGLMPATASASPGILRVAYRPRCAR